MGVKLSLDNNFPGIGMDTRKDDFPKPLSPVTPTGRDSRRHNDNPGIGNRSRKGMNLLMLFENKAIITL